MNRSLILVVVLILISCTNAQVTATPAVVVTATINPTATPPSPTATVIPSVAPSITSTPEPRCDPFRMEFCITEGHLIFQRPIQPPGNDLVDPTYRYGSTADGTREPHHGVEFPNASGTPVYAAGAGIVIFASADEEAIYAPWGNFYGNLVVIEHPGQLFTLYAHLSKIDVAEGESVLAGTKIGEVGRTGGAIGSHLHFEVRSGDPEDYFATQNPELWLAPAKDANRKPFGVLVISVIGGDGHLMKNTNFTIEYYSDPSQSPNTIYYSTSYSPDLMNGEENAALSELSAGQYRIAVEMNGQILERWVEVESGKLTQVVFAVK